jgi:hypothetical protein
MRSRVYEEKCNLHDRGPDRHGVLRVVPTIRNNWHEQYGSGNSETVADASLQEVGEEKSAEDKRFN